MTLNDIKQACSARQLEWNKGGLDPSLEFRTIELCGEVGELANAIKKSLRLSMGMAGGLDNMENIKDELADVIICAVLLGTKLDLDLSEIVKNKFNKTSDQHGFKTRI